MSQWDSCKGGGGVCFLSMVKRRTLINILEAKAGAGDTERGRKGGRGAEQDSPVFLSSLVSDCTDSGHRTAAAAALLRILGSPMSGSLKIMCAINKQTEAITGRERRGEERVWIRSG